MGASQHKESQIQSQPVLPVCLSRQTESKPKASKVPLLKKEIVSNFMESFNKLDLEKKELKKAGGLKGEIKVKKARELTQAEKENQCEEQEIKSMVRARDSAVDKKSGKKGDNAELFIDFRTAPLVAGQVQQNQVRAKKCRISKML